MSAALSSPPLRIVVSDPVDRAVLVTVIGEVDTTSADQLRTALAGALAEPGVDRLVVDLTAVPFLGVAALHPLLEGRAAAEAGGRSWCVLAGPDGGVERLVHRAGLAG